MIDNSNIGEVLEILKIEYEKRRKPIVTQISLQEKSPYKILVSTILSLRTKDEVTEKASQKLFAKADSPSKMIGLTKKRIENLIYPVGFYHRKAANLKEISNTIIKKYQGKIPDTLDDLLSLPGVGRKTANLVLVLGFDKDEICVDTHVHRISNRWGYVKTNSAEKTEFSLRKKLPGQYWKIYNDYLVSFGQNLCRPISPFCSRCKIEKLCPKIGVNSTR